MAFHTQKKSHKRNSAMSEINITPFVDVLLVLLIIFMVAAPMMTGSVELELPKGASEANQPQEQEPVSVSIKSDGTIFVQEERVKLRSIPERLGALTNNDLKSQIYVRADTKIDYGRVMEVVRIINIAGFTQVVLVTELSGS